MVWRMLKLRWRQPYFSLPPCQSAGCWLRCHERRGICPESALAAGLIGGLVESTPSVWHKEILWAPSKGIPMFGSSSTGAVRAADMWPFGLHGVGLIYRLIGGRRSSTTI